MTSFPAAIALGSNLGERRVHLNDALDHIAQLPSTSVTRVSQFYETDPVTPADAIGPAGGQYLNAAAVIHTSLTARELLNHLLTIERDIGRIRNPDNRWGPRTIDLDLLLYAGFVYAEPGLIIPHPRLHLRRFVLDPLAEIAPDWIVPSLQRSVGELLRSLDASIARHANNPT